MVRDAETARDLPESSARVREARLVRRRLGSRDVVYAIALNQVRARWQRSG